MSGHYLQFYFLRFPVFYSEGIEHGVVTGKREDEIEYARVVSEADILVGWARGRRGMAVPVGNYMKSLLAGEAQRLKLFAGDKREMLGTLVGVGHRILNGYVAAGIAEEIAARLVRQLSAGVTDHLVEDILVNSHVAVKILHNTLTMFNQSAYTILSFLYHHAMDGAFDMLDT